MKNELKDKLQLDATQAFVKAGGKGTICLSTGTGKSKVAVDFIRNSEDVRNVLITSPRTNLKKNWFDELTKWGLEYWRDGLWTVNGHQVHITLENIQTCYKWEKEEFDLIVMDEIHTMMTPEYSRLLENNEYKYLMGLTATHDITEDNDKEYFYKELCPIIYEYYDSAEDGLINQTRFFIVDHELNNNDRVVIKYKNTSFEKGEKEYYEYLTTRMKKGQELMLAQGSNDWFRDAANWFWKGQGTKEQKGAAAVYMNAIKARKNFLLNLPSTAGIAEKISGGIRVAYPKAKVLVFSELTAQADKISKTTVHSHHHDKVNAKSIADFNSGSIRELGSCNSLTLGLNLVGATHAVMESYIGSATKSKQKKGRLDRLATDERADMWIIRVPGTQSDKWFKSMTKNFDLSEAFVISSDFILRNDFDYRKSEIKTKVAITNPR